MGEIDAVVVIGVCDVRIRWLAIFLEVYLCILSGELLSLIGTLARGVEGVGNACFVLVDSCGIKVCGVVKGGGKYNVTDDVITSEFVVDDVNNDVEIVLTSADIGDENGNDGSSDSNESGNCDATEKGKLGSCKIAVESIDENDGRSTSRDGDAEEDSSVTEVAECVDMSDTMNVVEKYSEGIIEAISLSCISDV